MLCDWKVECACDRAIAKRFEADTSAAVLRNDNYRESMLLRRTCPDFKGNVSFFAIEVHDTDHLCKEGRNRRERI